MLSVVSSRCDLGLGILIHEPRSVPDPCHKPYKEGGDIRHLIDSRVTHEHEKDEDAKKQDHSLKRRELASLEIRDLGTHEARPFPSGIGGTKHCPTNKSEDHCRLVGKMTKHESAPDPVVCTLC